MRQLLFIAFFAIIALSSCSKGDNEPWVETKDVSITAYKSDPEQGKQYLEIIYENTGQTNIRKLKIELVAKTGTKMDTITKVITPETILKPKDRHLAKRPIGEPVATFDDIKVSRVWMVKE